MSEKNRRPNVLLILTDDQGYGDLSRTGNRMLHTPNIDALAEDGAELSCFFVQPVCAPTRAELLTGRWYPCTGVSGVSEGAERINLDETLISELFQDAGYATGCFGKWHSGAQYPYHPCGRGFDEFIGFCCGHWSHYFDSTIEHNGEEYISKGYLPDVLTGHAIDFIHANKDNSFFCYLPLNTPHAPWQVPDEYFEKFADLELTQHATDPSRENDIKTRCALAMCENIDENVGRVIGGLKDLNLYENTIVIYLSDNGPNSSRWNAGLRGIKGSTYEGGVRSPCSISYPKTIPAGALCPDPTSATDVFPTLCALCGIESNTKNPVHGLDLSNTLSQGGELPERYVYSLSHTRKSASVRWKEYRYHSNGELYHLAGHEGETSDVAVPQPRIARRLRQALDSFLSDIPPLKAHSTIPVGFKEWPATVLEPQDALLSGTIQRSSIHPNCSWICGWSSPEDFLTWHIEVENEGTYEVTIMYTAHRGQVGSRFAVECGRSGCEFTVQEAFNTPELRGFDRYPRDESYEKAFAPLVAGSLFLDKGPAELHLKALQMQGEELPHLRALKLTLL